MKSNDNAAHSNRCSVPAPSDGSRVDGWMAIAWQLRGKGRDRDAAEPDQNIACRDEIENAKLKIEKAAALADFQFSIFNFQFAVSTRRSACLA